MLRRFLAFLNIVTMVLLLAVPAGAVPPRTKEFLKDSIDKIVISTSKRRLYYYDVNNNVQTFTIAVGRQGRKWSGETRVTRKVLRPKWAPPPAIRKDNPRLPAIVMPGPSNPLGAAVLVLGDGTYGIHGNNNVAAIGTEASYGCFRMYNDDILKLFKEVKIGTAVTVLP